MKRLYFVNAENTEDLRKAYLKLAKVNHPDNGGDVEIFKAIQAEYEYLLKVLPTGGTSKAKTKDSKQQEIKFDVAIRKVIDRIIHMDGINIEIVGLWIWVDGNTYPWKDELKQFGFQWSRTRKKWHYSPYEGGYHKGRKRSFDSIRDIYGSTVVNESYIGRYLTA